MASLESASDAEAAINTSLCGRPSPFRMSTVCTAFAGFARPPAGGARTRRAVITRVVFGYCCGRRWWLFSGPCGFGVLRDRILNREGGATTDLGRSRRGQVARHGWRLRS